MMDRLPPEILEKIFIQLNLKQRLICTLVCRSWWRILDGGSLFYSIELDSHKGTQFKRVMKMFEELSDRAAQVCELTLVFDIFNQLKRGNLFNIFPNARVMSMLPQEIEGINKCKTYNAPTDLTNANSRLESLSDFYHCELVSQLLYSNLGNRLKTLYLDFTCAKRPPSYFNLSTLKNLPVLSKLTLRSPKINIQDLEELHGNIPSIQDFSLLQMTVEAGSKPSDVIPAISITKFKLYHALFKDAETYTQFYQYVAMKYTNMTDIEFDEDKFTGCHYNYQRQLHVIGIFDFYRLIEPSKKEITIFGIPEGIDPFDRLDVAGCEINNLYISTCAGETILHSLSLSYQFEYIEHLTIQNTNCECIYLIENMMSLTKLSIYSDFMSEEVSLVSVLDACPATLKSLIFDCDLFDIEPYTHRLDFIEILHIEVWQLSSELGDIISSCFPNLVKLRLRGEVIGDIALTLKSRHFQEAVIITLPGCFDINPGYGFSFLSSKKSETQYYFCTAKKEAARVQREYLEDCVSLSVVCLTEENVDLKNHYKQKDCHIWEIARNSKQM